MADEPPLMFSFRPDGLASALLSSKVRTMRYFFDIRSENLETLDDEGCELASEQLMQDEARRILARIAADEARCSASALLTARVRDAEGRAVYRAVLTLEGRPLH